METIDQTVNEDFEIVNAPFAADEERPFIFISYAHKSRNEVFPLIKRLYEKGWRIWYDEGLLIGADYYSSLKKHIEDCEVFLLFVTQASIDSSFVQEHEIPFAKELDKPFVECYLQDGLQLDLGSDVLLCDDGKLEETLLLISSLTRTDERIARGHEVKTNIPPVDNEYDYEVCEGGVRLGEYHGHNKEVYIPSEYPPFSGLRVVELDCGVFDDKMPVRVVHVPDSVHSIDWDAFSYAKKISDIYVPASVKEVQRFGTVSRRIHCVEGSAAYEAVLRHNEEIIEEVQESEPHLLFEWEEKGFPFNPGAEGFCQAVIDDSLNTDSSVAESTPFAYISMAEAAGKKYERLIEALEKKKCYIRTAKNKQERKEYYQGCSCIVTLIDHEYLKEGIDELRKAVKDDKKIAIYVTEECELPDDLAFMQDRHQLRYNTGNEEERIVKLTNYLSDNGCRDPHYIEDFQYKVTLEGIILTLYEGTDKDVSLKDEYGGAPVISIGNAFRGNKEIRSVVIPGSVSELDDQVFQDCEALKKVVLPEKLKKLPYRAFYRCKDLTDVDLPDGLEEIEDDAFFECRSLEKIEMPDSLLAIGKQVFRSCSSLKEVRLPDGVKSIGFMAFADCASLKKIQLPDGLAEIESAVFDVCNSLNYQRFDNAFYLGNDRHPYLLLIKAVSADIASIKIADTTRIISEKAFAGCKDLKEVQIPDSVICINDQAFQDCRRLKDVSFPSGLQKLGISAFYGCSSLKEALLPDSLQVLENGVFGQCQDLEYVRLPKDLKKKADSAFNGCGKVRFRKKWSLFG